MTDHHDERERRRWRALQRLGTHHPVCVLCGEDDYHCLELHHLAGQAYDQLTVILCRNCHRKQSDPARNQRAPDAPPTLERIGQLLLGLAQFLMALAERLNEAGHELLEAVSVYPPPYGRAGVVGGAS